MLIAALMAASLCGLAALPLAQASQDKPASKQDREKMEKELDDLEGQRAKLDSRIRELRKQLGRETKEIELKEITGITAEQKREIERAVAVATRAAAEATKNLPDVKALIPDIEKITEESIRLRLDEAGKLFKDGRELNPQEAEEMRARMKEMGARMKERSEEMRSRAGRRPESLRFEEFARATRGAQNPELRAENEVLRAEMRQLRAEMRELRAEVRRELGRDRPAAGKRTRMERREERERNEEPADRLSPF
jgi:hypothetical protein